MLAKKSVDQALIEAKRHIKKKETQEALKLYQSILVAFPKNKRVQLALAKLKNSNVKNVVKNPSQEIFNKIMDLYKKGKYLTVIEQAKLITKQYPEAYMTWNILGASALQMGILDQALQAFEKTTKIKPDFSNGYYNMGVALQNQRNLDVSIEAYNKAISLKPDYPEAYNNMGVALKDQGKLNEALEAFDKTIKLKPDHIEAYNNIGIILKGIIFKEPNPSLYNTLVSLFDQKASERPRDIAKSLTSLLKLDPILKNYLQSICKDQVKIPIQKVVTNLSELTLLLKLMSICPITDIDMEYLLTSIRASLLFEITHLTNTTELLKFQSALALQCFINEYIFNQSEQENRVIKDLENVVKLTINNNEQPNPQSILCLASYKPLNHYEWYDKLHVSNEIVDVFTRQVVEPQQENDLKSELPFLNKINNKISLKVREQYELNPYPRWVKLAIPLKPEKFSKTIDDKKLNLFNNRIREVKAPEILIAGCGTGQQSIETAAQIRDSKVFAIDLSLSSLAYAKRKTKELGVQNIEYMQADILELEKLNKNFDIIECGGVLHHMDDPFAGWQVLVNCLKPGGLMRIGLYSELARRHIVKLREEIRDAGIGSKDFEMKLFRLNMIEAEKKQYKDIQNFNDFYSLSEFRDLLFHVQEHRFTIPQIKGCLSDLGLKFCGFESENIISQFKLTNINKKDTYNLDKWHVFEEANPRAFVGMYEFWCQKIEKKKIFKTNKRQLFTTHSMDIDGHWFVVFGC